MTAETVEQNVSSQWTFVKATAQAMPCKAPAGLARTRHVIGMIFLLQEWEAIKSNHLVCDPVYSQEVADCFCDKKNDLKDRSRHHIMETKEGKVLWDIP
jgi:hypothetical protein